MPTPSAFISYSRADSEFALRLAQDLKAAGANVWLDQLDILPGHPWDNAIEDALTAAPQILIVLSPASSKSGNVRNEISYALEHGKIIIPVLYLDCVVPLQLQRTQRIDFRADYARGLSSLLNNLHVQHPDPTVLQRAAEGDAMRHAAWQARELQAQKMEATAEQQGAERSKTSADSSAQHSISAIDLISQVAPAKPDATQPVPAKPWWANRTAQLAAIAVVVIGLIVAGIVWLYPKPNAESLYQQAASEQESKNYEQAVAHYRQACDLKNAKACTAFAGLYETGNGVARKPTYAMALYDRACELGDFTACSDLALRYYNGDGIPKDAEKAAEFDEKACNGGEPAGCSQLGVLYALGDGVEKDSAKSVVYYQKACGLNDPLGCSALGVHYANGDGIAKDMKQAAIADGKACSAGRSSACTRLGDLYAAGSGVALDPVKAKQLYQKACLAGDTAGCDKWRAPAPK